jgi:hypothetical protein
MIRESLEKEGEFVYRDLVDLGSDPSRWIVYPGGNAYYVHESVEERLQDKGASFCDQDLDDLFFPYVRAEIRAKVEWVHRRGHRTRPTAPIAQGSERARHHLFDKRRILFLRCGRMHQGNVGRIPEKLLRVLNGKSRDEIEQFLMRMESNLRPRELKSYVFVIFDLQRHFKESYARAYPEMLTVADVDDRFVEDLCRLNGDRQFWNGIPKSTGLQEYLVRYLIMYFDYDWGQSRYLEDLLRSFVDSRRRYRPPPSVQVRMEEVATLFGDSLENLRSMSRQELTKRYRQRARKYHPDKGGSHEAFVRLTRSYRILLQRKPK